MSMKHRIIIQDNFINEEDSDILIQEITNPSEINEYPEYYKERFGGTAFPYNKTVQSLLKKYGNKASE